MSNTYPSENYGIRYRNNIFCYKQIAFDKLAVFRSSIIVNRVITSDSIYTISSNGDDYMIMADTTSNAISITLPTINIADPLTIGRVIHIIDAGGNSSNNNITITGSQNISGQSSLIINSNYSAISLVSSNTQWLIF
jgi:hypothetical protein